MIGWHSDGGDSVEIGVHVPVLTTPASLNRLGNLLFHMPAGRIHWLDYSLPHTVYNGDPRYHRVHIVVGVRVQNNKAFERHFLSRVTDKDRKTLLSAPDSAWP